jgi:Ala-tRNA(Pro) deacylase
MSIALKIKELLQKEGVDYEILEHPLTYTASETAQAQHIPGHRMVKSVIVKGDEKWLLCVLPATHHIDFDRLKREFGFKHAVLASEDEISALFPEYEVGAMPPFGQLASIPVYVDKDLLENENIAFNAGTHTDLLRIRFKDFTHLVEPIFGDFSVHV